MDDQIQRFLAETKRWLTGFIGGSAVFFSTLRRGEQAAPVYREDNADYFEWLLLCHEIGLQTKMIYDSAAPEVRAAITAVVIMYLRELFTDWLTQIRGAANDSSG